MAFTALKVIDGVFAVVGNTNATPAQYAEAVGVFNILLATISTEDFSIVSSTQDSLSTVDGTTAYSYGTGGDLNSARPIKIRSVFLRDSNSDDFPIEIITEEQYNDISQKDTEGRPSRLFYKPDFTLGSLKFFPTPDKVYTIKLNVQKVLASVTATSDSITLPNEYLAYLIDKLVIRLGRSYGYAPTREDHLLLKESEGNVKTVNSNNKIIRTPTSSVTALGRPLGRYLSDRWEE